MMELYKTKEEFYKAQTKEQLIIFLMNQELTNNRLENTLVELTGCCHFGEVDGTNGACVECFYENKELFNKCEQFSFKCRNKNKKSV